MKAPPLRRLTGRPPADASAPTPPPPSAPSSEATKPRTGLGLAKARRAAPDASPAPRDDRAPASLLDDHSHLGDPPPPGSSWDEYLDWASRESLDPSDEEVELAMRYWTGSAPRCR